MEGIQGTYRAPGSPSLWSHRTDTISVVDTYQYEDPEDVFSREPFILRVSAPHTKAEEFVLVPLHSAPHNAVTEIDALYPIFPLQNIMFLGDFNADCAYVQPSDWSAIRLRTSDVGCVPNSAAIYNFQRAFQLERDKALAVSDHYPVEVKLTA
nr:PREDICTED: deoxyribonuclease-1-like 2 [Phalacrocorax carbo]